MNRTVVLAACALVTACASPGPSSPDGWLGDARGDDAAPADDAAPQELAGADDDGAAGDGAPGADAGETLGQDPGDGGEDAPGLDPGDESTAPADAPPEDEGMADPGPEDPGAADPDPGALDPGGTDPGPQDPGADATADADAPPVPAILLTSPASGARAVVEVPVVFRGTTTCQNATVTFTADGKYLFASLPGVTGAFELSYAFHSAGLDRLVEVSVAGDAGCTGTASTRLTIQPAFSITTQQRTDANGNPFTARIARFPTADPATDLVVTGGTSAHTVKWYATSAGIPDAAAAVNGGYFSAGTGPVSYAKGSRGYESASGNVKGPRACLAWNGKTRTARVVLSMGRDWVNGAWGEGLFPADDDVVCAGPRLLEAGQNVFATHYATENFETSGIGPDAPLPRTALCVTADGSVLLVAAQDASVKARGFTLEALAGWLATLGCVDALNLDGGGSTAFWEAGGYYPGTEDRPVYNAVLLTHAG